MTKYTFVIILWLVVAPLYAQEFYSDSARVIGYTHSGHATGKAGGNRVSVRDSEGSIHVVFHYKWSVNGWSDSAEVFYVYSTDNGFTWSEMMNVSRTDSALSDEPALAIDSQNNLHCVWRQCEISSNSYDLYYSMYDGNSWLEPENITQQYIESNGGQYSSLVVDSNDHLHLVYSAPVLYDVFYIYYNGISWSKPLNLSDPGGGKCPCVTIDSQNNLHVTWTEGGRIIYTYYNGTSWTIPEAIVITGGLTYHPCIVVNSQNYPRITYSCGGSVQNLYIFYVEYDSTGWSQPLSLSNPISSSGSSSIAIDSFDNLYVVWMGDIGKYEVYYRTYNGVFWSEIINLTQDRVESLYPNLGNPIDNDKVDLVWASGDWNSLSFEVVYLGLDLTGITEEGLNDIKQKVKIYPNPFRHTLCIKNSTPTENLKIKIFDITGREVIACNTDSKEIKIDTRNLSNGVYFVQLKTQDTSITEKIVKLK